MKNILLLILFPLLVFSQHSRNMKGEKKADARIIDLLENYGKAYEYEDFESVANYFDYPTTFKSPIGNSILKDKEELNIIIKSDVHGSSEAIKNAIDQIKHDEVKPKILLSDIGMITETDITLAKASNAVVIAFNVKPVSYTHLTLPTICSV